MKMTDEQVKEVAAPKSSMAAGGALMAIAPQSLEDAFRLSRALAASGDMVPKHFQDKPEMIMAAIMRGAEIGLMPMQALANIAVINGRASLWGDALPALMQRAGHHIDVEVVGDGDNAIATATLTRGDTGKIVTRTFSVDDAKKANLWAKAGPWQQYPKRMLSNRARAWAVRDGAADALMGLQVAEEASDFTPIKDVTPREPGPVAQKAMAAREAARAASAPVATAKPKPVEDHIPDAEVLPQELDKIDYAAIDLADAFPGSDAWQNGEIAAEDGAPIEACPWTTDDHQNLVDWLGGFAEVQKRQGGKP